MSIEAMKTALEVLEDLPRVGGFASLLKTDKAIEALRTAIQQTDVSLPATAIACGITGMAKTTCPFCEQSFAFEHEQPPKGEPVWFHKHWGDGDDIFYRPDDKIPSGSTPLYTTPQPEVTNEREAFESCALMEGSLFKRRADDPDKYWDGNVQDDWELWKARAALQSPAPQTKGQS